MISQAVCSPNQPVTLLYGKLVGMLSGLVDWLVSMISKSVMHGADGSTDKKMTQTSLPKRWC